jgi:hypothetical protein
MELKMLVFGKGAELYFDHALDSYAAGFGRMRGGAMTTLLAALHLIPEDEPWM